MHKDVILPNLGFGMEEGRVAAWLYEVGQPVRKGKPIAEIEGDKTTIELEALADGILAEILVPAGETASVGAVLARLLLDGPLKTTKPATVKSGHPVPPQITDSQPKPVRISPVAKRIAAQQGVEETQLHAIRGSGPGGRITRSDIEATASLPSELTRVLAAPAIRKLAADNNLDLNTVSPSGHDGQITRADVEEMLASLKKDTETMVPTERFEVHLSMMRSTIARRLTQSAQQSPHFHTTALLDLTEAIRLLPEGIGVNALLLFLTAGALQDVPQLNATYEDGRLYQYRHVQLALAVALDDGLLTPVIHNADHLSLTGLAEQSKTLISRTRNGKLRPDDLSGGTFTISNLGMIEQVERFTAIINPPQIGILAIGAVKERVHVINGGLHIRKSAYVTLCADHRFIDGIIAARFLQALEKRIHSNTQ